MIHMISAASWAVCRTTHGVAFSVAASDHCIAKVLRYEGPNRRPASKMSRTYGGANLLQARGPRAEVTRVHLITAMSSPALWSR